jgi:hypothetical protein
LPALSFIGLVTFQRLAQITSEDIAYAQRIARLREFYVDVAPRLEPYLTIVRGAAAAQRLRGARPHPSGCQLFLTLAGMVALVNSVIVGAAWRHHDRRNHRRLTGAVGCRRRRRWHSRPAPPHPLPPAFPVGSRWRDP